MKIKEFHDAVTSDVRNLLISEGRIEPVVFFLTDEEVTYIPALYKDQTEKPKFYAFLKQVVLPSVDDLRSVVLVSEGHMRELKEGDVEPDRVEGHEDTVNVLVFNYYTVGAPSKIKAYEIKRDASGNPVSTSLKIDEDNLIEDSALDDYFNPKTKH